MKTIQLCLFLLWGAATLSVAAMPGDEFYLSYDGGGLVRAEVKEERLTYIWYTTQKASLLSVASLEAYDRHEVKIWLKKTELARFREWATKLDLERFKTPFPESYEETKNRAGAFQTALTVGTGASRRTTEWTGNSKVPEELIAAEAELRRVLKEIERDRREQL